MKRMMSHLTHGLEEVVPPQVGEGLVSGQTTATLNNLLSTKVVTLFVTMFLGLDQ